MISNKEWLATLSKEVWWEVVDWLFHEYGKQQIDTRLAVMDWLEKEHKPIMTWDFQEQKYIARWE